MVLIAFTALTIIFAHNFWTMEGVARAANQAHFYKNLGLIGGLPVPYCAGIGALFAGPPFLEELTLVI